MDIDNIFMINGVLGAKPSQLDRGFTYGDGLFETIALIDRKLPFLYLHLERLVEGCERLYIPLDLASVSAQIDYFLASLPAKINYGVIKLLVSRGEGGRGYAPPEPVNPSVCLSYHVSKPSIQSFQPSVVALGICELRLGLQPKLAGIKHLNRLENVLARMELSGQQVDDGVLLDVNGTVVETTSSNIFYVKNNRLITPVIDNSGVNGVIRRFILSSFAEIKERYSLVDLECEVRNFELDELFTADEIFCTNSVFGVRCVSQLTSKDIDKSWSEWPVAFAIQQFLANTIRTHNV